MALSRFQFRLNEIAIVSAGLVLGGIVAVARGAPAGSTFQGLAVLWLTLIFKLARKCSQE